MYSCRHLLHKQSRFVNMQRCIKNSAYGCCLTEKWAKCYRHFPHCDTDTNMYLERYKNVLHVLHIRTLNLHSFHNQLKTVHLNGKVNHRVDYLLHHLLQYEKDVFFTKELANFHQLQAAKCAKRPIVMIVDYKSQPVMYRYDTKYSYKVFNKHLANCCVYM